MKMDEKEYLKTKEKIREYRRITSPLGIIGGIIGIIVGFVFFCFSLFTHGYTIDTAIALIIIGAGFIVLCLGWWVKRKARDLEIELEVFDKQRQQATAQQPISQGVQSITQLQYCPSCGKKLQSGWKVCGYCGKRLKGSI